jgi:uncharacterized protein YjbI with pentapeptide repeats
MSEKTHLALLKHGVTGWNEWRAAHEEIRPELSGAGLCGFELANANLAGANLRKCDLRGSNLSGATLAGADLEGADFFRAILDGADLSGANLIGARSLNCWQLEKTRNWQSAFRDPDLACGASIPRRGDHPRS